MDITVNGSTLEVDPGDGSLDILNLAQGTTVSIHERMPYMPSGTTGGTAEASFPANVPGTGSFASINQWCVQVNTPDRRRPLVVPCGAGNSITGINPTVNSQVGALAVQVVIVAAIP